MIYHDVIHGWSISKLWVSRAPTSRNLLGTPEDAELMKESEKPKGMGKGEKAASMKPLAALAFSKLFPSPLQCSQSIVLPGQRQGQGRNVGPMAIRMVAKMQKVWRTGHAGQTMACGEGMCRLAIKIRDATCMLSVPMIFGPGGMQKDARLQSCESVLTKW